MDLQSVLGPVIEGAGIELVDVTFRREGGGKVLRVTIDRDGGVDLAAISEVSKKVSRRLDAEGFDPGGPYSLEVTSPGLERPLRRPEDFRKRIGQKVKVRTTRTDEGARVYVGSLLGADDDGVTIATEAGDRRVSHEDIAAARTVFEWGPKPRRKRT